MATHRMLIYLAISLLATLAQTREVPAKFDSDQAAKIINGTDAELGEYPSFVAITNDNAATLCGGTILNRYHILTAAHCVNQTSFVEFSRIVLEHRNKLPTRETVSMNGLRVEKKCQSPNYGVFRGYPINDFAILKLAQPIDMDSSQCIAAAKLPTQDLQDSDIGWAVGFGCTEHGDLSDTLKKISLRKSACNPWDSHGSKICLSAGDDIIGDTGGGDSGGPVMIKDEDGTQTVVGITSYGLPFPIEGEYGVYANVFGIRKEIEQLMEECS